MVHKATWSSHSVPQRQPIQYSHHGNLQDNGAIVGFPSTCFYANSECGHHKAWMEKKEIQTMPHMSSFYIWMKWKTYQLEVSCSHKWHGKKLFQCLWLMFFFLLLASSSLFHWSIYNGFVKCLDGNSQWSCPDSNCWKCYANKIKRNPENSI